MSPATWFAVALLAVAASGLTCASSRAPALGRAALAVLAVAEAVFAAVGFSAVLARPWVLRLGDTLGFPTRLGADPLAGFWLALTGVVGFGACLLALSPARRDGALANRLVALTALMLLAVAVTITARDAFTLVLAWEVLTFTFYGLGGYRGTPAATRSGLVAYVFGKSSGAALLLGLLLLAAGSGSLDLAGISTGVDGTVHAVAYALLLLAFGVKVGLVPVHVWMPPAYESAPAGVRALMAGVAVNAGFYGLWRTVDLLGSPPLWLLVLVLLLAGLTALLGIAHAAVATQLPRVIAWSSVENAGLITVGLAVAMVGARIGDDRLLAVGLLAGTLQAVTHAFAKALLFASTGTFESVSASSDVNALQGAAWRSPYSGTGFVVGALTLAAIPPTIGFASEWFLLEALMQQFRLPGLLLLLTLALTGALVALTTGFAGVTFVRLTGFVAFGRRDAARAAIGRGGCSDVGPAGRLGLATLVFGCLGVAAFSPVEVAVISRGMSPVVPASITHAADRSPWVLQPVYAGFSALSPSWMWVVMPLLVVVVWAAAWALSRGRMHRVRRVPPWRSASGDVVGDPSYTAFAFSNPTRKVLANVLRTRTRLVRLEPGSGQVSDDARDAPDPAHLGYTSDVVEVVETYLYRPLRSPTIRLVRAAQRLQSGRLDAYVTYMLLSVVAVLAVAAALG